MRFRALVCAAAVAATVVLPAATATAAPAGCGSTADQWPGTYDGAVDYGSGYQHSLHVVVTRNSGGALVVRATLDGVAETADDAKTSLSGGQLYWESSTDRTLYDRNSTAATCSGGTVSAFDGRQGAYLLVYPNYYTQDPFSVTRSS